MLDSPCRVSPIRCRRGSFILTVIHRKQLADLRRFIKKTDPEAFVIINDTYDVLGKGFKSHLIT